MSAHAYTMDGRDSRRLGLIVLQSDETIEDDFRRLMPASVSLHVSRVPSAVDVTPETLGAMEGHLTAAAALLPRGVTFDAVGYACTSGTAQIGTDRIADQIRRGTDARQITTPLDALVAACRAAGPTRLAMLSPYIESVSARLRAVLAERGIETPVFASFDEAEEARVARIDAASVRTAALATIKDAPVDGLFLSCTNLRTLEVIADLERQTGLTVLSSNLVLAWHMARLAGALPDSARPADLLIAKSG